MTPKIPDPTHVLHNPQDYDYDKFYAQWLD